MNWVVVLQRETKEKNELMLVPAKNTHVPTPTGRCVLWFGVYIMRFLMVQSLRWSGL
jgi:hypothetical protein